MYFRSSSKKNCWLLTHNFWSTYFWDYLICWSFLTFWLFNNLLKILVWSQNFHIFEDILSTEFWVSNPTLIIIVYYAFLINTLLICLDLSYWFFLLSFYNKIDWDIADCIFLFLLLILIYLTIIRIILDKHVILFFYFFWFLLLEPINSY